MKPTLRYRLMFIRWLKQHLIKLCTRQEMQRYTNLRKREKDRATQGLLMQEIDWLHYHRVDACYLLLRFIRGEKTD